MIKVQGMFVTVNDDGSTITSKVKRYSTYAEMVEDSAPEQFAIVDENNTVYHRVDDQWVIGFPNIDRDDDYTAFEVYANDTVIPVGYCEALGGEVREEIPVGMTHKFVVRGSTPQEEQDVVVDWGDGTIEELKNIIPASEIHKELDDDKYSSGSYSVIYSMEHTNDKPGKYIVKVFGTTYKHIQCDEDADDGDQCNLICRIFDKDLPIASHLNTFDSMCRFAKRLLSVNLCGTGGSRFLMAYNVYMTFSDCTNLLSATGFNKYAKFKYIGGIFRGCSNLITTDFVIPQWTISCTAAFYGCVALVADVAKILPQGVGFSGTSIEVDRLFTYDSNLYGTVPAAMLWESTTVNFVGDKKNGLTQVFKKCSTELMAQVPTTWGGTKTEE